MPVIAEVILMHVFSYVFPKEVLATVQMVSKAWHEAANNGYNWRDINISALNNKSMNGLLLTHGKHLNSLQIQRLRLSRKATYTILHKCKSLLTLNLKKVYSCSMLDDRFCFLISKIQTLKTLILPAFTSIGTTGFKNICKLQNLETLCLQRNSCIRNFTQLKMLEKLRDVDLSGCPCIDNSFCHQIAKLKIHRLVLSFCFSITLEGIKMFFAVKHLQLHILVLNGLNYTPEVLQKYIAKKAPNLHTISLNSLVIDQHVYNILPHFKHLKNITIIGCSKITDFRIFKHANNICICRTMFDVVGSRGLVAFAARNTSTKVFLYDNYAIGNRQELFTHVKKLNNVTIRYS